MKKTLQTQENLNVSKPIEIIPEEEADMDDPEVLKDFIDWGLKKYPADRYGLIFWNHGNQWRGYGGDKDNGSRKSIRPNMKSRRNKM